MELSAPTQEKLLRMLSRVDIRVPPLGQGRTHEHVERYGACHLLSTLAAKKRILFPMTIQKRESPDFVFEMQGKKIGIEITESNIPSFMMTISHLNANNHEFFLVDSGKFRQGKRQGSKKNLHEKAQVIDSPPWFGQETEHEWATAVTQAVNVKAQKFSRHFEKFQNNWLYIYDNLHMLGINLPKSLEILQNKLIKMWESKCFFDTIFIQHYGSMVTLTRGEWAIDRVNNLWA